jgi:hypothetical protein
MPRMQSQRMKICLLPRGGDQQLLPSLLSSVEESRPPTPGEGGL